MSEVDLGREAESLAEALLGRAGLIVLGRRVRNAAGELDLVAREGATLVFVEVKGRGRTDYGRAEEMVDGRKQARLAAAAEVYLSRLPQPPPPCRFDVVAVEMAGGRPRLRHIRDAFRPGE